MPDFSDVLKRLLKEAGAALVGYADLEAVPERPFPELARGVALGLAFDPFLARRPGRPLADAAYVDEYYLTRARLDRLVRLGENIIKAAGHQARGYGHQPFFDGRANDMETGEVLTARYQHKTTATRAGLGWIGKMGVLVTKEYGPAVWLGTILTDAPLPAARPRLKSACGRCRLCQDACPAGAIKGGLWRPDKPRDSLLDVKRCQEHRRWRGRYLKRPMCGLCLAACPFGPEAPPQAKTKPAFKETLIQAFL